ncbi:hypothetical protein [Burkholderia cepacia]|uniref:hypothetical protein n=1 Tax=Burkholderia cepacia TaxID=292 RepID=UPI0021AB289A|nr:hypothetical protein [Burkholderia cepacia]
MMYRMFGRFAASGGAGFVDDDGASLSTPPHDASDIAPAIAAQTTRKRKACNGEADFFIVLERTIYGIGDLSVARAAPKVRFVTC